MAKCAVRCTPLRLRLWFYIVQGLTNALWKNIGYNGQLQNKICLIVIHRFSLVKAAMNDLRICKLRNGVNVNKMLQFYNPRAT
jgi:hypothetical protein